VDCENNYRGDWTVQNQIIPEQYSCNTIYLRNMACFRYIIVNTMHKGDNKVDDDDDKEEEEKKNAIKGIHVYLFILILI
jgi:hypothetical protein